MKFFYLFFIFAMILAGIFSLNVSYAQFPAGGVSLSGDPSWFVGEGLKKGDFFSYSMCHVDYKECSEFKMDMWIKGDTKSETEDKWLVEVVVYDGNKVIKGEMELGKLSLKPFGDDNSLGVYQNTFESSIVWLSAFANGYDNDGQNGPKKFSQKSWGKIGNIGGEQIIPTAIEKVTVSAGTFDTVLISWKTGGTTSKVWVVDNFPFPIKAQAYTHVSSGIPPPEYRFELLKYNQNITSDPFSNIHPNSEPPYSSDDDSQSSSEETLPPITVGNKQASLFIKISPSVINKNSAEDKYLKMNLIDVNTGKTIPHTSFFVTVDKDGRLLMRDLFHTHSGDLTLKIQPENLDVNGVIVYGDEEPFQGGWTAQNDQIKVRAPILLDAGLYHFEIQIFGIDNDEIVFTPSEAPKFESKLLVVGDYNKLPSTPKPDDSSNNYDVDSVSTDKKSYQKGDTVNILGKIHDFQNHDSVVVKLKILDPSGKILEPKGTFGITVSKSEFRFSIPSSLLKKDGDYTVIAYISSELNGKSIGFGFFADGTAPAPQSQSTDDTIPPEILIPSDIHLLGNSSDGLEVEYSAKAIDNVDQILTPECSPSSGSIFPVGQTIVVCTATDSSGNSSKKSFIVTIELVEYDIPPWVKDVAGFWCSEEIDDPSFIQAVQYLISAEVIVIPTNSVSEESSDEIPKWIKNNACWWSQGVITDGDFVNAIQYLIEKGIIAV